MKNFYFLGNFFPHESESEIVKKSIGFVQNAANVLQWKIISGLEQNIETCLNLVTACSIGSFPKHYRDLFMPSLFFSHSERAKGKQIGFLNLAVIKQYFYHFSYKRYIQKSMQFNDNDVVIAYSAKLVDELLLVKRKNPRTRTCLIIPDLPHLTSLDNNNKLLHLYKDYESKKLIKAIRSKSIDVSVVLTKQMAEYLSAPKERFAVLDGICNDIVNLDYRYFNSKKNKTILYTGTLAIKYGILGLIDEFKKLKGDYRLVICGGGDECDVVERKCKDDPRIDFKGLVSHSEALALQKEADILVNPRKNDYEFTKYSFPSKLLEYLSTGKPVVCYKLDGVGSEYDDIFFYAEEKEGGLAEAIYKVSKMSQDEYSKYIHTLSDFLKKKTAQAQCKKIICLLESVGE